ncbi:MAG: hypothetical protein A3F80_08875 [Candidatus Melainabacteria bacterium RIFCSPLOWO2_12_FULL_35_11]|nr:MAG: hypothetical protein A3F80_08875 [Candidatus Melainabacteria bacterium RIFCSPLOWO2_12_FULL_35_11]
MKILRDFFSRVILSRGKRPFAPLRVTTLLTLCILIFSCKTPLKSEVKNPQFKTLSAIYNKELQYLKAKVDNDFNSVYSFQHPEYKAIVTIDKFKASAGGLQLDYSSITEKNPNPQVYTPSSQFHSILHDIKVEKAFIDKDGRYAKFHTVHVMSIFLPIARGVPVRREMKSIDYWERVNGEWVILNKVRPAPFAHISGAATKNPINLPEEKAEYIEIPLKEIESVFEEKK